MSGRVQVSLSDQSKQRDEIDSKMFKGTTSYDPTAYDVDEEQGQRLEFLSYYHRRLNRIDSSFLVQRPGEFLVRKASDGGRQALSVHWRGRVLHFPIRRTTEGQFGDNYVGNLVLRDGGRVLPIVIKSMNKSTADGKDLDTKRDAVLREARILRDLDDHPNIAKCFGSTIDSIDGRVLTAMELIRGGRLDERLRALPQLTPTRKHRLALAAAKALMFLHCHGYIHRNICAKNFLIEVNEQNDVAIFKLVGFHFAQRSENGYRGKTADRMPSPIHSSPESLGAYFWTKRSDVWSWAVLVWEIFCNGTRPYNTEIPVDKATNWTSVLQAMQNGAHLRPHAEMNETMLSVWKSCMHQDSDERPTAFNIVRQLTA